VKTWLIRIVALFAIAGAIAGGVLAYRSLSKPAEITYRTAKADRGNVVARVTATGTLSAHVTVLVGSQVSGRISQINVDFNSPVKKGEVIARIDPQMFEASVASARANAFAAQGALSKAKAQVADAEKKLERAKALRAEGLASQADLDTATTAVEVARAEVEAQKGQLEQARASQRQAEVNLAYTTIVSPIDGTVISRNVDVGQTVAASLQAPTLFTIAEDLRKMQVDTNITEGDVGKLKPGMRASFVVDAYPSDRFSGVIQQIRNSPQTVQNVVTYDAVIDVENTDLKLKPGMTANVTIIYDRRENALRVPNAALRFRAPAPLASAAPSATPLPPVSGSASASAAPSADAAPAPTGSARWRRRDREAAPGEPGVKTLWVMRGGPQPIPVQVRTGLTDGTLTEIVAGEVKEDDEIVLEVESGDGAASTARPQGGGQGMPRMRL
jgi:HlyD family secretion protein